MTSIFKENQMKRAKFLREQQGKMEVEEIETSLNPKNQSEEVKQAEEDWDKWSTVVRLPNLTKLPMTNQTSVPKQIEGT